MVRVDIVLPLPSYMTTVPAHLLGVCNPAAASSILSNEVMCSAIGNPTESSGMHGSLACTHAVVPRQVSLGAVCYILQVWCLCCWSIGGKHNVFVSTVEHIALFSRERWQTWRPQLSQVRATGRTVSPMKTSNLKLIWWLLQGILFQAVMADVVTEHALRLPQPVVSRASWVRAAGSSHHVKICKHSKTLRFDSLNLSTIRKKEGKVVETYL